DRAPAFDRPIEAAEIGRGDRARRGAGDAARLGLVARALERFDAVIERLLVFVETGQPLLGLPGVAPRLAQVRLALAFERDIPAQLVRTLLAPAPQLLACVDEQLALPRDAIAQLAHVVRQQSILPAHQKEILVARQQIAEALGREQHLPAVQRAALVDVHQA